MSKCTKTHYYGFRNFIEIFENDDKSRDDELYLPGDDDRNIFDLFDGAKGKEN